LFLVTTASRLAVVSPGAEMQVHPAALPLAFIDLAITPMPP
jgi:hypothetical protein